jgi:hypothetical protein
MAISHTRTTNKRALSPITPTRLDEISAKLLISAQRDQRLRSVTPILEAVADGNSDRDKRR